MIDEGGVAAPTQPSVYDPVKQELSETIGREAFKDSDIPVKQKAGNIVKIPLKKKRRKKERKQCR
jgi:hypothetical protein